MVEGFQAPNVTIVAQQANRGLAASIIAGATQLCDEWGRMGAGKGAKFSINADAHAISHFDWLPYGLAMARRAGLTKGQVGNCWGPGKLVAWLLRI